MSTTAATAKLARTLCVSPEKLAFLGEVPTEDLRQFRLQVADMLFERQAVGLRRIASAAQIIPAPIVAKLVSRTGNALLAARMAGVLDPDHAVDVAKRLSPVFLAEVATLLDPRRSAPIVGKLPIRTVVAVTECLADRQDWITLGDLVTAVDDAAAGAALGALPGVACLRTGYLIDEPTQLNRFVRLASRGQLTEMLHAAAEYELWDEFRSILAVLDQTALTELRIAAEGMSPPQKDRALAEITREESTGVRGTLTE